MVDEDFEAEDLWRDVLRALRGGLRSLADVSQSLRPISCLKRMDVFMVRVVTVRVGQLLLIVET